MRLLHVCQNQLQPTKLLLHPTNTNKLRLRLLHLRLLQVEQITNHVHVHLLKQLTRLLLLQQLLLLLLLQLRRLHKQDGTITKGTKLLQLRQRNWEHRSRLAAPHSYSLCCLSPK